MVKQMLVIDHYKTLQRYFEIKGEKYLTSIPQSSFNIKQWHSLSVELIW